MKFIFGGVFVGYQSNVRISTTKEGFEEIKEIIINTEKELMVFQFLMFNEDKSGVVFGWDGIRWYDDFDSISQIQEVMDTFQERDIPYKFIRVGENEGDIEIHEYKSHLLPYVGLNITFEIG